MTPWTRRPGCDWRSGSTRITSRPSSRASDIPRRRSWRCRFGRRLPTFPLPASIRPRVRTTGRSGVAEPLGIIPGSDSTLSRSIRRGVGPTWTIWALAPGRRDSIYNAHGQRLRRREPDRVRSLRSNRGLAVPALGDPARVTGEEKGSRIQVVAAHPTCRPAIVADSTSTCSCHRPARVHHPSTVARNPTSGTLCRGREAGRHPHPDDPERGGTTSSQRP